MSLIRNAARLAHRCHAGQIRRGGKPYITHPHRVADMVMLMEEDGVIITDEMIAAAWLHDVYEDCDIQPRELIDATNRIVDWYVKELTNVYVKESYSEYNRRKRKTFEAARLAEAPPKVQIIKLCDRIDNLKTIHKKGKKFSLHYCEESEILAAELVWGPKLQAEVFRLTKLIRKSYQ